MASSSVNLGHLCDRPNYDALHPNRGQASSHPSLRTDYTRAQLAYIAASASFKSSTD